MRLVSIFPHRNDLASARSMLFVPGARKMLRPALPYRYVEGIRKAAVSNHLLMERWPEGRPTARDPIRPAVIALRVDVRAIHQRAERGSCLRPQDAAQLPSSENAVDQLPGAGTLGWASPERDLPHDTTDRAMRPVEAGKSTIEAGVERVLRILAAGRRIVGAVALVIDRLRPGVGARKYIPP